ncbi:sensor histidine kinase YkoH [Lentibacillus populi]|uniref:histidine kinase n=1 Tax=Lentibacillus populi TaxID=1827502 RepID=A0A9W5TXN6_9BACI|nr:MULTISPECIES: HAMP domain-containing sensor histidine kinase [Bacillaceae]GGB42561.1 sensor histidine kinase YkoH [Lentibacillus populi]
MSLRTRIQLSITVLLIIMLLIANTSIYLMFKRSSIESAQNRLVNTSSNIIKDIKELHINKQSTIEQVVHAYLISDGMISLVDQENRPITQTTTDNNYFNIKRTYRNDQYEDILTYKDSKFVTVSMPVIDESGDILSLQIIENGDELFSTINKLKGILIFTSVLVISVLCIAGWVLGGVISRPVQRFIQTMKTIEEKESYKQIAITKSKRDEINQLGMTFNSMIKKLEASYLKQEQFVSDASHELKTPLTVIAGYVNLLKRWGSTRPEVVEEAIKSISSESIRMKYLTEQLLELASAEKLADYKKENIDIISVIKDTISKLEPVYQNNVEFVTRLEVLYAEVHEQSFIQLLIVLLDNANKYSSEPIKVRLEEEGDSLKIHVEDKGPGIPLEAQPYIFDRMYRVDKDRSRKTGGTGLGLSIAKRISEQHGGYITLKSVEGLGSTFTVVLPKSEV